MPCGQVHYLLIAKTETDKVGTDMYKYGFTQPARNMRCETYIWIQKLKYESSFLSLPAIFRKSDIIDCQNRDRYSVQDTQIWVSLNQITRDMQCETFIWIYNCKLSNSLIRSGWGLKLSKINSHEPGELLYMSEARGI